MRKIVFFDIDGTIITDDDSHIIPESTALAIKLAREKGNLTFINTGRTISNVEPEIRNLGFDGYICGCGMYIECDGKILQNKTMPKKKCLEMVSLIRKCDMTPLYERSDSFFTDDKSRTLDRFKELMDLFKTQGKNMERHTDDIEFGFDKFVAWYDEKSDLELFKREISNEYQYIDRGWGFCEIVPNGYSKATGIMTVLERYGISLSDAYVIGDSLNDLPMILAVPNSIAMGNGNIHEYASFVTKDIYDDGVYYALRHFDII